MRVLIPVDGSYYSDTAVDSVVNGSWPQDTSFYVLSVIEPIHTMVDGMMGSFGHLAAEAQQMFDDDIRKVVQEAAEKLKTKFGAKQITEQVQEGAVSDLILEQAKDWRADLIVMGAHGTDGNNDAPLGSVCMRVLAHAPCSVRLVHDLTSASLEKKIPNHAALVPSRILLAINNSTNSQAAVESVLNRPWADGTIADVLTIVAEKGTSRSRFFKAPAISQATKKLYAQQKGEAEKVAKQVADKLEAKLGKGKVTFHVLEGSVRSLILQIAQDWPADLIVIGAHDKDKTVLEHVFGSVARAVAANANCSVEIVRKPSQVVTKTA